MKDVILLFITITCLLIPSVGISAETPIVNLYQVEAGDVININVLDHRELTTVATVTADGTISFPYIGNVMVKGMTLLEIEKEITERLQAGYVKYAVVSVSLLQSKSRMIYMYGEFNRRGEIPFMDNMTVIMAFSIAGGVTKDGLYGKLTIMRKDVEKNKYEEIDEAPLKNGLFYNPKIENMILKPDDMLVVELNKTFLIQGEIAKRGRFALEEKMTVLNALIQAGGVSGDGLYGTIKVRRKNAGAAGEYMDIIESRLNDGVIESRELEDTLLQPDDIVVVMRSKTYSIQGEVAKRGRFILETNMTVVRALLEAGGVTDNGLYGKIKIRRKLESDSGEYMDIIESRLNEGVIESQEMEDTLIQPDDILIIERNESFLVQGEVAKRGRVTLEKDMTVLEALLVVGGVTDNGRFGKIKLRRKQEGDSGQYNDLIESKLNDGVIESQEMEDILIQPDDILIIERNKTFYIYGEVNNLGEFILEKNMSVFKALTVAGGFTKWGSESRVKVLRLTENSSEFITIKINVKDIIGGDASADIFLEPGDTIVVSKGVF